LNRFTIVLSALLLSSVSPDASAQGFVNPFVGTTLTSPSATGPRSKPGLGIAFGKIGRVIGAEAEIAYYPELLNTAENDLAKTRVLTFSGNTLIGPTIGPVKVYGALGAGNLHLNMKSLSSVVVPDSTSLSSNYFAFNVGGGVMGFFTSHLGLRGDLRFYRAFGLDLDDLQSAGFTLDRFEFWRASFGLAAKF
jgi:outer membrane protein with beta-barrel domain